MKTACQPIFAPFTKYQASGNDFILVDNRNFQCAWHDIEWIKRLCDRHRGIGADGLVLLESSTVADYRMRIFNSDGREASMCGNGIRCLFAFIKDLKNEELSSSEYIQNPLIQLAIETNAGVLKCRQEIDLIAINLGIPKVLYWPIDFTEGKLFVVDTGVPHAVLFVDALEKISVQETGKKIRFHSQFLPHGVNVNFVTVLSPGKLKVRSYERGIEAETVCCGTGSAASAFVASQLLGFSSPVIVYPFLGQIEDCISFQFPSSETGQYEIEMLGTVQVVFHGKIAMPISF